MTILNIYKHVLMTELSSTSLVIIYVVSFIHVRNSRHPWSSVFLFLLFLVSGNLISGSGELLYVMQDCFLNYNSMCNLIPFLSHNIS